MGTALSLRVLSPGKKTLRFAWGNTQEREDNGTRQALSRTGASIADSARATNSRNRWGPSTYEFSADCYWERVVHLSP